MHNCGRRPDAAVVACMFLFAAIPFCSGCGGRSDAPRLAEAGGVVTYQGAPVEGATVTFLPDDGLPAVANTDAQGRFTFMTRGESGAVVGPGKVSIAAVDQDRELSDEEFENISSEELSALRISRIPEKYNSPVSSGLTITVSEDPQQNQFPLDLK